MSGKRKSPRTKSQGPKTPSPIKAVDVETLAAQQGVVPIVDPADLLGDFWPEEDSIDEFIAAVRRWRHEGKEP